MSGPFEDPRRWVIGMDRRDVIIAWLLDQLGGRADIPEDELQRLILEAAELENWDSGESTRLDCAGRTLHLRVHRSPVVIAGEIVPRQIDA